jgi:hypothetical protein
VKTVRHSLPALVTALLAMLCLLALGPAPAAATQAPHAIHICTEAGDHGGGGHAPAHDMDCGHCPLCAALAAQAILPQADARPPLPSRRVVAAADIASAAAPHRPAITAAPARGPPA